MKTGFIANLSLHIIIFLSMAATYMTAHGAPQLPEPELAWKNVSAGGRKTAVFSIFKDSRGIAWIGTNGGLFFYDGVTSHAVGKEKLNGAQVYSIVEKDDRLYIGSNNGLLIYDYTTGEITDSPSPSPKEIRTLLLVDDKLWIGGLEGISRLNITTGEMTDCSTGLPHRSVYSIIRDSRGIIYAGTYNGVARWDSKRESFGTLRVRKDESDDGTSMFANCMLEADDGESIYIGGEGSLFRYTPANEHWEKILPVENNNIKSLAKGEFGHILVGTDNGLYDMSENGLRHYRHDSRQELSLADNEIWCIYTDQQNNIWVGHGRGFSLASNSKSLRTLKLSTLAHSGEGNEIHVIHRSANGDLWLGGTNGAIRLTGESDPHWHRHSDRSGSLSHNRIRAINEDAEHNIWFATDAGINRFDRDAGNFDVFHITDEDGGHDSKWVYAMVEDGDHFWIGSFLNGLQYICKSAFENGGGELISERLINSGTSPVSLPNDLINNVIKDVNGDIWVLLFRDSNLTRITPSTGAVRKYDIHALTGAYPTHICTDSNGRVWCAYNGGAILFDTSSDNHDIIRFPPTDSDETTLAIGRVGNGVWISTLSNVWSIDGCNHRVSLLPIPQRAFTAVYEDTVSGKVLLGGTDEIVVVDRDILDKRSGYNTIRMVLNDNGEGYFNLHDPDAGKEFTIPYGGGLSLVVSSLDYSTESVQRYMYKLTESPADTLGGWIVMPEGANTITFSDLKMGDYNLMVKAIGTPSTPVSIPLHVQAPVWLSWWAILIYIIVAVVAFCLIIAYLHRKNLRHYQEEERRKALENVEKKLTFLSNVSHDLKTPLSMILGPVSLMKERVKDGEIKKSLELVYDNAVRLNNMIHKTIELQHLENADDSLLILSTFDVVEFCKSVFETFRENHPQKTFVFHSSCNELFIEGDAVKFESVMTNLLSNACKYSEEDATISCGISSHGDKVEIAVSDDGLGIDEKEQSLVFQRMFRAPSTANLREGTGLGLYLIKKYLELMDGNIDLYSRKGQGTSFIITLPASEKAMSGQRDTTDLADTGKPKILIVEDNAEISAFIKKMLEKEYAVLTAENGRSGLAIASSIMPDLIIADEMMPIMTGLEMCRRMRQIPRLAATPIIMLTAKADPGTENESVRLGIDAFMTKPFEPVVLAGRIRHMIKQGDAIREKMRIEALTETKPIEAESATEKQLAKIARIIEENIADPDLNVNYLCEKTGIQQKQLYRIIKKYMDIAPVDYIKRVRLQKAAMLLGQKRFTVSEICYMVGFKTPSYFARCFQAQYGVKPSQYTSDDV